jgi:acyl carrier protein
VHPAGKRGNSEAVERLESLHVSILRRLEESPMTPSREDIIAIIAQEARIDADKLTPDATLVSLDIASLDVVSVLFAIEDTYGVEIDAGEMASATTLGAFVDIIMARVTAA